MDNCNKIKNTCTDSTFATCVDYQGEISEHSGIEFDCITIHDTTQDIYELIDDIYNVIDISTLGQTCLTYTGTPTQKDILERYEEEICALKTKVEELESGETICSQIITGCGFSFGDLVDPCGDPITTLGQMLQIMMDQINANTA